MRSSVPGPDCLISPGRLSVVAGPLPRLHDLAPVWCDLERRATASFFLSWTWIGAWLATLEESGYPVAALHLVTARRDGRIVGLAIIGAPKWRATLRPQPIFLNQSGEASHANLYIEYNDILADAADVRMACLDRIRATWPRRRLRVQAATNVLHDAMNTAGGSWRVSRADICDYADLSALSPEDDGHQQFLALLSANTRQQITRARRRAESVGALSLTRAETPDDATSYLAELIALHERAWRARKQEEGAFVSPTAKAFVTRLVRDGVANGTVELLRVRAGTQTIGILLNFVFRGEAFSYQSGFAFSDDNRDKPGLLCHALAAADYIRRGVRAYHFMAGASRYKRSLSNATETLRWLETYPNATVARVENAARALWHKLKSADRRASPSR